MKEVKNKKNNILLEAFDALFIMILCFATLFSAMMLKGSSSGGIDYSLNFKTLSLTIIVLIVYFVFIIKQSDKGLKDMISKLFDK